MNATNITRSVFTDVAEIKDRSFAENELAWAFLTNIPIMPGHSLVCPKRVVSSQEDLTEAEWLAIGELAKKVKMRLREVLGAEGFNVAWNEGEKYGQSVPHFHLHIVPRTPGDKGIAEYEPRAFLYRPGSREASPEAELAAVAAELRFD